MSAHETHVCRDCGASITIPYATPAVTEPDLRAAALALIELLDDTQLAWGEYPALDDAHEALRAALATPPAEPPSES